MYYFIVNPKSSSGKGGRIWQSLEPFLKAQQTPYQVFFTKSTQDTQKLAHDLSSEKSPCVIVAVGGDGTANDVVNGLCNFSQITFGYIPTGSGNDLARGLHLQCDPQKALHGILNPSTVCPLSVGLVEASAFSRRFLISCGIGYDAAVCVDAMDSKIKAFFNHFGLGKLTYTCIALKRLLLLKPSTLSLSLDQEKPIKSSGFFFSAAMNLPYEGGGFMFCPAAVGEDDRLDLILVEKLCKLKLLFVLPAAFYGKHTHFRQVHIHSFQNAVLETGTPLFVHTDGEIPGKASKIAWSLLPEKLPFILN